MELTRPPAPRELRGNVADPLGNDEDGAIGRLREEVSHWSIETARQDDAFSVLGNEGKGALDAKHAIDVILIREQSTTSFGFVH
jgi:hypothetical protein